MIRLKDRPNFNVNYNNIDIVYANDEQECDKIISFYVEKGYQFIVYTPSKFYSNAIDHYSCNPKYLNTHHVIGQEFDKVVLMMDENFKYDINGELSGKEHPNPDYIFSKLFYQNITRVREKLCIVVLNNKDLFSKLLLVKNKTI